MQPRHEVIVRRYALWHILARARRRPVRPGTRHHVRDRIGLALRLKNTPFTVGGINGDARFYTTYVTKMATYAGKKQRSRHGVRTCRKGLNKRGQHIIHKSATVFFQLLKKILKFFFSKNQEKSRKCFRNNKKLLQKNSSRNLTKKKKYAKVRDRN